MSSQVSTNYRLLVPAEVSQVAAECANAWLDQDIPARQAQSTLPELTAMRKGVLCAPFDALVKCLQKLPSQFLSGWRALLDVGASFGYYSEVLKHAGYGFRYTGLDFSREFQRLAVQVYPEIDYECGDARQLPFANDSFDIVLHGSVILHCAEYEKAIQEAARVASKYIVFHRTPIVIDSPTRYYEKEAYGVRCLEIHFNERELLDMFDAAGLELVHSQNIFWSAKEGMGHWSYLLKKRETGERQWESA